MSAWIVETLIATTILMVLVLLVRGPVARKFGARTAYLLWLLPALRMVLPPLPETVAPAPIAHLPVIIDLTAIETAEAAPLAADGVVAWGTLALAIWLTGALSYFLWHIIAYRRFVGGAIAQATQLPEMDRDGIEVCASKAVDGPFAAGVFIQKIVLPQDYKTRYSAEELHLAMRHEAAHHRRGDLSANYLALAMLSLHWFNPVAHRAWRAFRADQELACDAIVLAHATPDERHSYGSALVKSACSRTPVAACSLNPRDQLKLRLRMMRDARERGRSGRALAAALVCAGLALTASGGVAAETSRKMESQVRDAMVEKTAMIGAVVAPAAAAASTLPAAPDAPDATDSPPPPASQAAEEWSRVAEEAWREALEAAKEHRTEALREAEKARREAMAVARRALPPISGSHVDCNGKGNDVEMQVGASQSEGEQVMRFRVCAQPVDHAQIRAITLEALTEAREAIARTVDLTALQRRHALASIDVQLARLKGEAGK